MQQLSQSVCIGVTLSFGWLGKLSREAANRVRFEPRATFELRATSVPGPKGLRGRRPHSNCVSSNRVQQLSQSVCIGVTLSFGWLGKLSREAANRVRFEPRATFDILISAPFQKYITPMVFSENLI